MVDGSIVPDGKICTQCGELKPRDQFFRQSRPSRPHLRSACKACTKEYADGRRLAKPDHCKKQERESKRRRRPLYDEALRLYGREWQLRKKYGMTVEDFTALLACQDGGCAICHRPVIYSGKQKGLRDLACVDHDHDTKEIRGILCQACNTAIGLFGDDPARLRCAAEYLERHALGRSEWTPAKRLPESATEP